MRTAGFAGVGLPWRRTLGHTVADWTARMYSCYIAHLKGNQMPVFAAYMKTASIVPQSQRMKSVLRFSSIVAVAVAHETAPTSDAATGHAAPSQDRNVLCVGIKSGRDTMCCLRISRVLAQRRNATDSIQPVYKIPDGFAMSPCPRYRYDEPQMITSGQLFCTICYPHRVVRVRVVVDRCCSIVTVNCYK